MKAPHIYLSFLTPEIEVDRLRFLLLPYILGKAYLSTGIEDRTKYMKSAEMYFQIFFGEANSFSKI